MTRPLKDALTEANPNKLAVAAHQALLGSAMAQAMKVQKIAEVSGDVTSLADDELCDELVGVYVSAGGAPGLFTVVAKGSAPAAGEAAATPDGQVAFNAADAVTEAELVYLTPEGVLVSEEVEVAASGAVVLPASKRARMLVSADLSAAAASGGAKAVVARGSAPGAGEAAVADDGQLAFNGADVGASPVTAQVSYYAWYGVGGVDDLGLLDRLNADTAT